MKIMKLVKNRKKRKNHEIARFWPTLSIFYSQIKQVM